ncbi:MAG: hypothetical protein IIA44_13530 [Acidobacteria bacterium]|nr:hypothetical protein [Acidobacteriota bacterium]
MPVNYQESGVWAPISLAWSGSGTSRSAPGAAHKIVLADQAMTMRWPTPGGLRDVRMRPDRLIKFNVAEKTWTNIVLAQTPSGVTPFGSILYLHNIYPGVDRRLEFFNDTISDGIVFHQSARDQLQALGGWDGHWLGSVSDFDLEGIPGARLRNYRGETFTVDSGGLLLVEEPDGLGFDVVVGGDRVIALSDISLLQGPDGAMWSFDDPNGWIKIRRFLVVVGGRLKLVELFDPIKAGALPAGDLWHDAVFGSQSQESGSININGKIRGFVYTMGSTAGTMDSITCYLTDGGGTAGNKKKYAIYLESDASLIGQTTEEDPGTDGAGWYGIEASGTVSLSAGTDYIIAAWSNFSATTKVKGQDCGSGPCTVLDTETYNGFPDPASFSNTAFTKNMSIYCTYTEDSDAVSPRRRRVLLEASR